MNAAGTLQHRIVSADRVQLTLTGLDGREASAVVAMSYMRAKVWGILADIDPAGVVEAALGDRNISPPAAVLKGPMRSRILWAVNACPLTVGGIRRLLGPGDSGSAISTRCRELVEAGELVVANGRTGRGYKAIYQITDLGALRLQQLGVRA